ncbi:M1 family metallopeptidase [Nonlabens ponticola]|nr:M1 family metallopeptidase [Nonlabens ponticola]
MRYFFIALLFSFSTILDAQGIEQPKVDFITATAQVEVDTSITYIKGSVSFEIQILEDVDTLKIDARNLDDFQVTSSTHPDLASSKNDAEIVVVSCFRESKTAQITINYTATPTQALYFIDKDADGNWDQAWTQGQGKYTSNWMPSIDDVNEKMIWDISVIAPNGLTAIANGKLLSKTSDQDATTWNYDMTRPMSSYLLALAIGDYASQSKKSERGTPLQFYYYPEDKSKLWSTYQQSVEIFNFLEKEIGIAYPWQNYKQVPVKDFLYAGMENTGTTFFDDQFVQDAAGAIDRSYVNVNAHELSHQWFGNLVTAQSGEHHWLQEGFATYYALLAEKELYGNQHFMVKLYENAEALADQTRTGKSIALLDPKASSLTFYQHGAWAAHALRELVGDAAFKKSIKEFLQEYSFKSASTDDLLNIMTANSGKDLSYYKKTWLLSEQFPSQEALRLLRADKFMEEYLQLLARRISPFEDAYNSYKETLKYPVSKEMVLEMIAQLNLHDDYRKYSLQSTAASINNAEIRQLIALTTREVTPDNQNLVAELLLDKSYLTRESAMYLLWNAAINKEKMLRTAWSAWDTTNESLEMAWLVLAINTDGFIDQEKLSFTTRLQQFTAASFGIETRMAAFDYLKALDFFAESNYIDLLNSAAHHNWRYYTYARNLIKELQKDPKHAAALKAAMDQVNDKAKTKLEQVLDLE